MADQEPSVLKKKLDAKNSSSNSVKSMSALWSALGKATAKAVKSVLEKDLSLSGPELNKLPFGDMKKHTPGSLPVFEFRAGETNVAGFVYFSPDFATAVTDKKLDCDEPEDEPASISLLDIYFLDPVARALFRSMNTVFSAADSAGILADMAFTARCLSLDELKHIEDETDFMKVSYSLAIMEGDEPEGEASEAAEPRDLSITFCFLYPLLERLSVQAPRRSDSALDFDDPWTEHMHSTVLGAEVAVSAVLENCAMSVGECSRLEVGQVISLPGSSLDMLTLKVKTREGTRDMAYSALGVLKQNKAVKLLEDPAPGFMADLPGLVRQSSL